ncbi:MAG: protein kinase, partial [Vicinamibacterales bacterium]
MLAAGTRLGSYEVAALVGAGAMGEVYRARDLRLSRDVAIKVLPGAAAADPERLVRFEQEARAAAVLNHPNILAVYDIGAYQAPGSDAPSPYIVSELLEGGTLGTELAGAPLPLRKTLEYAVQIAHGLAAAHDKGIVHRDLKPDNVFITADGRVKILDFGLAKLTETEPAAVGASMLPTSPPGTLAGMVLGTVGYMAPEQVRGLVADHRADIFAFGAVLYEMLSGQRAFRGDTAMDTMMAIVKDDPPPLASMRNDVPAAVVRVVERCLEKNPAARFQSTHDLAFALEGPSGASSPTATVSAAPARPRRMRLAPWSVAGLATAVAAAALISPHLRPAPPDPRVIRFTIAAPAGTAFPVAFGSPAQAISADGRHMVFVAVKPGLPAQLWVRSLDAVEARPLAGTEGATSPFWSPDGRFIGFFADGKLKRISPSGGSALALCDAASAVGGSWNADGVILFGRSDGGVLRVSAAGGEPAPATTLDVNRKDASHRYPRFLPDGRRFVYLNVGANAGTLFLGALDSPEATPLGPADSGAFFAPPGYLLFVRQSVLLAQPFDLARGQLSGDVVSIAEDVTSSTGGATAFAVSPAGVVSFRSTPADAVQMTWFDRAGARLRPLGEAAPYQQMVISHDGTYVAAQRTTRSQPEIWVIDAERGTPTRLAADRSDPVWSPDGRELAYYAVGEGSIVRKAANGTDEAAFISGLGGGLVLEDWSRDGRHLVYSARGSLWALPLPGESQPADARSGGTSTAAGTPIQLTRTGGANEPQVSPDGRWLAYSSSDSGRVEIYVQPFPGPGQRVRVSTSGGAQPKWRADGQELFYLALD